LAAIAYADKNRIKISMVDPKNAEGTVPVTLYNGSTPGTYEITKRTVHSLTGRRYVWPSAMQDGFKAYAKAVLSSQIPTDLQHRTIEQVFSAVYETTVDIKHQLISSSSDSNL